MTYWLVWWGCPEKGRQCLALVLTYLLIRLISSRSDLSSLGLFGYGTTNHCPSRHCPTTKNVSQTVQPFWAVLCYRLSRPCTVCTSRSDKPRRLMARYFRKLKFLSHDIHHIDQIGLGQVIGRKKPHMALYAITQFQVQNRWRKARGPTSHASIHVCRYVPQGRAVDIWTRGHQSNEVEPLLLVCGVKWHRTRRHTKATPRRIFRLQRVALMNRPMNNPTHLLFSPCSRVAQSLAVLLRRRSFQSNRSCGVECLRGNDSPPSRGGIGNLVSVQLTDHHELDRREP